MQALFVIFFKNFTSRFQTPFQSRNGCLIKPCPGFIVNKKSPGGFRQKIETADSNLGPKIFRLVVPEIPKKHKGGKSRILQFYIYPKGFEFYKKSPRLLQNLDLAGSHINSYRRIHKFNKAL